MRMGSQKVTYQLPSRQFPIRCAVITKKDQLFTNQLTNQPTMSLYSDKLKTVFIPKAKPITALVVSDGQHCKIYEPKTATDFVSCCQDTCWYEPNYLGDGPVYIIVPKNPSRPHEKYWLHIDRNFCLDRKNRVYLQKEYLYDDGGQAVPDWRAWVRRYPEILNVIPLTECILIQAPELRLVRAETPLQAACLGDGVTPAHFGTLCYILYNGRSIAVDMSEWSDMSFVADVSERQIIAQIIVDSLSLPFLPRPTLRLAPSSYMGALLRFFIKTGVTPEAPWNKEFVGRIRTSDHLPTVLSYLQSVTSMSN